MAQFSTKKALAFAALAAFAGCFNEPTPEEQAVPEGAHVYLQEKGLGDLSKESLDAAKIVYLNLDRNALTNVAPVATLTNLKWLRLNHNRLAALPDFAALKDLRRIYLAGNRLTTVPETLKDLPSLTDIELSGNPITEVPAWLAQKEGLQFLSLNRTKIQKLPADLSAWRTLKALQLGSLNLSSEEMARIRAALPKTAIVF